jgi:hypothetical protein
VVDDHEFHRSLFRFHPKAELILQSFHQRRSGIGGGGYAAGTRGGGASRVIRGPEHADSVFAFQARCIGYRLA